MRRPSPRSSPSLATSLSLLLAASSAFPSVRASFLDTPRAAFLHDVLEAKKGGAQEYCKPSGQIRDACCDFETVESVNHDLFAGLHELVATPYFRYHKVDLFKECPFWQENGFCMNRACGVETTEEDHIPEAWRSSTLGQLKHSDESKTSSPVGCSEISDSDFCVLEDELDSEGVYVDLLENPERFTGYAGPSSARVWKAIYEENCFSPIPFIDPSRPLGEEGGSGFPSLSGAGSGGVSKAGGMGGLGGGGLTGGGFGGLSAGGWGESEKKLLGSLAGPRDAGDEQCLEKRVFYRVISGLHASISVHICDDYLDQTTGEWSPNLPCFISRIGQHPERLENMYFTYVLLLRALSRSGPQLIRTMGETAASVEERRGLEGLVGRAKGCERTFDERSMFSGGAEAEILKSEFKSHFRNVSRIMDCVGCDKCRLWGKMQVTGLGTALKLLFSYDSPSSSSSTSSSALPVVAGGVVPGVEAPVSSPTKADEGQAALTLSRSEVVAFINTLHRLSESLEAVDRFRTLWAQRGDEAPSPSAVLPGVAEEAATKVLPHYTPVGASTPLNSAQPAPPPSSTPEVNSSPAPPTLEDTTAEVGVAERVFVWCQRKVTGFVRGVGRTEEALREDL